MKSHTPHHELEILNTIHQNEDATQRELSEQVGLSLGAVNLLIKKLTKKGLIKIVRLQPNSIKYFLTPEGISSKIERTYQYIARTYKEVIALQLSLTYALEGLITEENRDSILFFGPDDELKQMLVHILKEEYAIPPTRIFTDIDNLQREANRKHQAHIITWNTEYDRQMKETHLNYTNIMHRIAI